jgi:hypothetical protein
MIVLVSMMAALLGPPQVAQELQRQTGVITGTLVGKEGSPIASVRVVAMSILETADSSEPVVLVSLGQTDAAGRYRLEGIPPGKYYVAAGYVATPTFYPGVTSKEGATVVSVAAGQTLSNLNFSVSSPSSLGVALSGRLAQIQGSSPFLGPFGSRAINRVVLSGPGLQLAVPLGANGSFEFPKIPPGDYLLRVPPLTSIRVTLTDRDIMDLEVRAPFEMQATGRVVMEDGSALPNAGGLNLAVRSPNRSASWSLPPDGVFTVNLIEGDNELGVNGLPLGYSMKSISYAGRDIGLGPLQVGQKPAEGPVLITLAITPVDRVAGYKVRGTAKNIPMELFSAGLPLFRLEAMGAPILEAPLQRDGSFEFSKVPPGKYVPFLAGGRRLSIPDVLVQDRDIDLEVDLENNPFPEYPGSSVAGVFLNRGVTLEGTITQSITGLGPQGRAPARYFRMDVKNAASASATVWAVLLTDANATPSNPEMKKLQIGAHVRVVIYPAKDGNPRGYLVPQTGDNAVFGVVILD